MRHGLDFNRMDGTVAHNAHGIIVFGHFATSGAELCGNGLHMFRNHIVQGHITAGNSCANHIAPRFNLVRNDGIRATMQLLDATNLDNIRTGTVHISTHHVQAVGKVYNMRLTGNVFQNGQALRFHSGQHGVHGGANGNRIKKDMAPSQVLCTNTDHAVFNGIIGTHSGKGFQVLVNRARSQIAATGHGNLTGTKAAQQRAQKIITGTHLAGKLVRYLGAVQMGRINFICAFANHADAGPQLAQDLEGGHNIADTGKVFDGTFICRENGGRQNCHSGILGAADNDIAVQGLAPMNHKLFQAATLLLG